MLVLRRSLWLICVALPLSGCFRVTFVDPAAKRQLKPGTAVEEHGYWQHKFAYGLINMGEAIDVRDVCGAPPLRIQTAGDVLTTGATLLTLGIYSPRKVYVECAERRR
ncbi:MAG: hypothetical protein R3B89_02655 [Polyangiaceae bacterium]